MHGLCFHGFTQPQIQRADPTPLFYRRDLSICGYWYSWGSWNQSTTDTKGLLYYFTQFDKFQNIFSDILRRGLLNTFFSFFFHCVCSPLLFTFMTGDSWSPPSWLLPLSAVLDTMPQLSCFSQIWHPGGVAVHTEFSFPGSHSPFLSFHHKGLCFVCLA